MKTILRAIALAAWFVVPMGVAADSEPAKVVERLHGAMLETLKGADKEGYAARYARLLPVVTEVFDSEFMARAVIGHAWDDLSAEDQSRWVQTFRQYTVANYASRLDHFSGQKFEHLGEEVGENNTVMVGTRVVDPASENVNLTYRLRLTDGVWKIIDVFAKDTVSEIALRRSEYGAVLKKGGIAGLMSLVNAKIAEAEGKKNSPNPPAATR